MVMLGANNSSANSNDGLNNLSHNIGLAFQEYRRLWELATRREVLTNVPLHLDVEMTDLCNLKCKMCWQGGFIKARKGHMDFDLFKKIIDEGVDKGVKAIKLQSRGEAMLHPNIVDAIIYAKGKGILDVHLTTNATLLSPDKWHAILHSGIDILNFSLDISHQNSFDELFKASGKSYESVIENVKGFLELKKKEGMVKPFIKLQIANVDGRTDEFMQKYIAGIQDLADKTVINKTFDLFEQKTTHQTAISNPCQWLWQRMVINFDGKATICCRDYNCSMIMGDIKKQPLEAIWNGDMYLKARGLHSGGMRSAIPFCAACELF